MQDLVPLGTGNSRTLKSNISADTTLPQLIAMLRAGTLPIDIGAVVPAGVSQQGTPLSKANLLADTTAASLGLTGDPTINDALAALAGAEKVKIEVGSYVGSGLCGEQNKNQISLVGTPKMVMVYTDRFRPAGAGSYSNYWPETRLLFAEGGTALSITAQNGSVLYYTLSPGAVAWYTSNGYAAGQLNTSGTIYFYMAFTVEGGA